jgi:fructose-1,6-bisphosphatase/inositol monophosphatase family enzyme
VLGSVAAECCYVARGQAKAAIIGKAKVWDVAAGWVIAHMVLRIIIMSQGEHGAVAEAMVNAPIAREVYQFRTWNALMQLLFKAKLGPDFNPDVN